MNQFEILAPAGGMESLIAGVRCGADAVYLGGKAFSARQNAGNFDNEALGEAVEYCHIRGVKVYLTVNILLSDKELEAALFVIQESLNQGVDGFIIQDLGLAQLVKHYFPSAHMHASTQMSITSASGFRVLEHMGFVRAVVPRELSQGEIAAIHKAVPIELEAFVHGALCMCVSGQCYMSAMLGSRSGNRGRCAQPCRLPFYVEEQGRCNLSLKDLSLVEQIHHMASAGVVSFKIEGRMKRPEYVAAAVTACNEAKLGLPSKNTLAALQSVFSRSGFTQGYFEGRLGTNMFGTRQKEDVVSAKDVLGMLARLYQNEVPLVGVDFTVKMYAGQPVQLAAAANGKKVAVSTQYCPEPAVNKPIDAHSLTQRMSKCGGTPFYARSVTCDIEQGLIVPAAELNGLRRAALNALSAKLAEKSAPVYTYDSFPLALSFKKDAPAAGMKWRGVFDRYSQLPENANQLDFVFLPLEEQAANFSKANARLPQVGVVLPRGIFGNESEIIDKLTRLKEMGIAHALCGNLGGVKIAWDLGFTVHGDFGLNIFNSHSLDAAARLGVASQILSLELKTEQFNEITGNIPVGAVLYGRLPLMLTRNCPIKNEKTCKQCGRKSCLTDRKGIAFPVRCSSKCSEVLNSRPLYMADRLREVHVDFGAFLFTVETAQQAGDVISDYLQAAPPHGEFTRGLYYRGVE